MSAKTATKWVAYLPIRKHCKFYWIMVKISPGNLLKIVSADFLRHPDGQ